MEILPPSASEEDILPSKVAEAALPAVEKSQGREMAAAEAEEEAVLKARVDINMVEIPDQTRQCWLVPWPA